MDPLLEHFKVNSHYELSEYIRKNPEDPKVIELKKLLKEVGVDFDKGEEDE